MLKSVGMKNVDSEKEKKLLSIITVNLNNVDGLRQTMESVKNQSADFYEHVIVDGGSKDGSKDLIEDYALYNRRCTYWVSEPDCGIYNAMNKGIDHATGDYLLFLNSGDYLNIEILQEVKEYLNGTDLVYGNLCISDENGIREECYKNPPFSTADIIDPTFYLPHPATFINRRLFSGRRYDENLKIVSDWKFWLECLFFDRCAAKHINRAITVYNMEGVSAKNLPLVHKERELVLESLFSAAVVSDLRQLWKFRKSKWFSIYRMFKRK